MSPVRSSLEKCNFKLFLHYYFLITTPPKNIAEVNKLKKVTISTFSRESRAAQIRGVLDVCDRRAAGDRTGSLIERGRMQMKIGDKQKCLVPFLGVEGLIFRYRICMPGGPSSCGKLASSVNR